MPRITQSAVVSDEPQTASGDPASWASTPDMEPPVGDRGLSPTRPGPGTRASIGNGPPARPTPKGGLLCCPAVTFEGSSLWKVRQKVGTDLVLWPGATVLVQREDGRVLL